MAQGEEVHEFWTTTDTKTEATLPTREVRHEYPRQARSRKQESTKEA